MLYAGAETALSEHVPQLRALLRCCREASASALPRGHRLWVPAEVPTAWPAGRRVLRPGAPLSPVEQQVRPGLSPFGDPERLVPPLALRGVCGVRVYRSDSGVGLAGAAAEGERRWE